MRTTLFIGFLLLYNVITIYSSVAHDHQFSWTDEESCSAYITSISHNSDTSPFSENQLIKIPNISLFNIQTYTEQIDFEFTTIFSKRAPPIDS